MYTCVQVEVKLAKIQGTFTVDVRDIKVWCVIHKYPRKLSQNYENMTGNVCEYLNELTYLQSWCKLYFSVSLQLACHIHSRY